MALFRDFGPVKRVNRRTGGYDLRTFRETLGFTPVMPKEKAHLGSGRNCLKPNSSSILVLASFTSY